jgi:predicted O-methyltransferase YrrM
MPGAVVRERAQRALPEDGRLITLEVDPRAAEVARANLAAAGLAVVADVRLGSAADTLQQLASAGEQPFDLIFIDADKTGYRGYLDWSLLLSRPRNRQPSRTNTNQLESLSRRATCESVS